MKKVMMALAGLGLSAACTTGREDLWTNGDGAQAYYTGSPGLTLDAAKYLVGKAITALGLDASYPDAVPEGMVQGKAHPPAENPQGVYFAMHHQFLSQAGIHLMENVRLSELAADKVWTSCTMVLPLRIQGVVGSQIRPVSIGAPTR